VAEKKNLAVIRSKLVNKRAYDMIDMRIIFRLRLGMARDLKHDVLKHVLIH